jgi:hypothetical protein
MAGAATVTLRAVLQRLEAGDQGTFGTLWTPGPRAYSGELPPRENRPGESCVPAGRYLLAWAWSPHLGKFCYRLLGVPGRAGILLHSANLMGDRAKGYRAQLLGCVSAGQRLGYMDYQKALLLSRPAVGAIEDFYRRQPFEMEVRDA